MGLLGEIRPNQHEHHDEHDAGNCKYELQARPSRALADGLFGGGELLDFGDAVNALGTICLEGMGKRCGRLGMRVDLIGFIKRRLGGVRLLLRNLGGVLFGFSDASRRHLSPRCTHLARGPPPLRRR